MLWWDGLTRYQKTYYILKTSFTKAIRILFGFLIFLALFKYLYC